MQETWVPSLGQEDPLEKEMATHSSIHAWKIPQDRGAWRATAHRVTKSQTQDTTERLTTFAMYFTFLKGSGFLSKENKQEVGWYLTHAPNYSTFTSRDIRTEKEEHLKLLLHSKPLEKIYLRNQRNKCILKSYLCKQV